MASRSLVPLITVALTGAFLACNALTGVGDLETSDLDAAAPKPPSSTNGSTSGTPGTSASSTSSTGGSDASSSTSSSSSSSSSSGEPDSGSTSSSSSASSSASSASSSSGGPAPVTLISEPFSVDHCKDWTAVNAFVQWQNGLGHDAPGMCIVCAGAAGDYYMTKTVTAPRAGKVTAQMYATRVQGLSDPTSAQVVISAGGSDSNVSSGIGADFTLVKNALFGGTSVASGAAITIKLGRQDAANGECFEVDDVTATLD